MFLLTEVAGQLLEKAPRDADTAAFVSQAGLEQIDPTVPVLICFNNGSYHRYTGEYGDSEVYAWVSDVCLSSEQEEAVFAWKNDEL